jgi:GNAT superfamily N-acetyltransferase
MNDTDLDNPFWTSLQTCHRHLAIRSGQVARFPADHAPFLAVPDEDADMAAALETLLAPGESVYLLGVVPAIPPGWSLKAYRPLAQMVRDAPLPMPEGPGIIALDESHRADVLALTALVYPHYFRERTMDLGRYFGIYLPDANGETHLAAMIGERLGADGAREMSAICTHPDFLGRGLARRLTAMLTNDTLARGRLAFLHVSHENTRAKGLYEHMGYRLRREIGFWSLRRR